MNALAWIVLVWMLLGLAGWLMSGYCWAFRSSKGSDDVAGFLLSLAVGPFYWLWYWKRDGYCVLSQ